MLGAIIFSNTVWTFWDVFVLFFIFIPLVMLWFFCMIDVFARRDLSGWGKAGWLLAILIFPWIGSLVYLIARPSTADRGEFVPDYGPVGSGYGSQPTGSQSPPSGKVPSA